MTREEMRDYAAKNWGLENEDTILIFKMYERGDTAEQMEDFLVVTNFLLSSVGEEWED